MINSEKSTERSEHNSEMTPMDENKGFSDYNSSSKKRFMQLMAGGALGCAAGYLDGKFAGEKFGMIIAGSLLATQILDYSGLCDIVWNPPKDNKKTIKKTTHPIRQALDYMKDFATENLAVASGFVCGYFLGSAVFDIEGTMQDNQESITIEENGKTSAPTL